MLCSYCNADLKPGEKVCPICGKQVEGLNSIINQNQDVSNNISAIPEDVMDGLDKSIFEPLQSEGSDVEKEPLTLDEQPSIIEEQQIQLEESSDDNKESVINPPLVENFNVPSSENNNRKHTNNMWMVPIIVIIFLVAILGFVFYVSRSPKMVFNTFVNNIYKKINNNIVTDVDNIKGSIVLQTNITTEDKSANEIFEILNNIYISTDYEVDYENETILTKINTKYGNDKLVDADIYLKDTKGYILIKDVYDKYLNTDIQGFEEIFEKAEFTRDHKIVLAELKKAINKSLKSEYFEQNNVDIKLNNETVAVTKNSIVLTDDIINNIGKDIIKNLKENNEFISSLSDIIEIEESEILSNMEEALNSFESNKNESSDATITLSIYTKGLMNELVKIEAELNEASEKSMLEITKESKDAYAIVVTSANSSIDGKIKLIDDKKIEFSLIDSGSGTTIGFTIETSIKYNTELTKVDVSNNVSVEHLTEEDLTKIQTKLMESKGIQNLINVFNSLSFGTGDNYVDEYGNSYTCGEGVECSFGV